MTSEKFLLRSVTLNGCSLGCDEAFSMSDVFTCEKYKKTAMNRIINLNFTVDRTIKIDS